MRLYYLVKLKIGVFCENSNAEKELKATVVENCAKIKVLIPREISGSDWHVIYFWQGPLRNFSIQK